MGSHEVLADEFSTNGLAERYTLAMPLALDYNRPVQPQWI
jgi:hypothetical protein